MPYCWKCGEKLTAAPCPACGATDESRRPLPPDASEEAQALRAIYDRYGCKQVLTQPTMLYNALGDFLGEDGRKLRNQVRTAMDAGLGRLYLSQLTAPTPNFDARAIQLLIDEDFAEPAAQRLKALFDQMTGLPAQEAEPIAPEAPAPAPQPEPAPAAPAPAPQPEPTPVAPAPAPQPEPAPVAPTPAPQPEPAPEPTKPTPPPQDRPAPAVLPPQDRPAPARPTQSASQPQKSKAPIIVVVLLLAIAAAVFALTRPDSQSTPASSNTHPATTRPAAATTVKVTEASTITLTETPTVKVTATPTVKVTEAPTAVPRSLKINPNVSVKDNKVTVTWTDTVEGAEYTVDCSYYDPNSSVDQGSWSRWRWDFNPTTEKSYTFTTLIPGRQYLITVSDGTVSAQQVITVPAAANFSKDEPSSAKSTLKVVYLDTRHMPMVGTDIDKYTAAELTTMARDRSMPGKLEFYIDYGQLMDKDFSYSAHYVITAPNGLTGAFMGLMYYHADDMKSRNRTYDYWEWMYVGEDYFQQLYDTCGSIPAGTYTVELYLDYQYFTGYTFTLK